MNIIMSRALPHHHPLRGPLPARLEQQQNQPQQRYQTNNMSLALTGTPTSPQSPLDFTDSIPFDEVSRSNETLGSGSFGTVYKGRWRNRKVAIKQFRTREEINSFLVEVKQLSCVKHPNIVTLYGASTSTHTAYLIMEYAEGGSLNHLLHENKLQNYDLRHACSWAMQTARGVAYLHSIRPKPIMHRDLKPANLLLFMRGKILKICDFGTACDVKTQMTSNTGSPSYMAPEVFKSQHYLESGDVFSWSIIFWETLVRRHPYDSSSSNVFHILWNVTQGSRPCEIEDCPQPIWNLITRSWSENPKSRPSMNRIAQEMEFILSLTERKGEQQIGDKNTTTDSVNLQDHQQQQAGLGKCKSVFNKLIQTTSLEASSPPSPQPHSSSHLTRPSLPSFKTPTEISLPSPSGDHMITSDHSFLMRQQNHHYSHIASTSSSAHHYHYQNHSPTSENYKQYQNYQQIYRQQEQSINSQVHAANRKRALLHYINSLQDQFKRLEDENKCDKKSTADVSFEEFERLKDLVKLKRRHMKTMALQPQVKSHLDSPQTPVSPTEQQGQQQHKEQQQQQQSQQQPPHQPPADKIDI